MQGENQFQGSDLYPAQPSIPRDDADLQQIAQEASNDTITLSTGVVVKPEAVPTIYIQRLYSKYPEPKPPVIEVMVGDPPRPRKEENPNDPFYLKRVEEHNMLMSQKILGLVLMFGLKIVNVPPDLEGIDGTDWSDALAAIGEEIPPKGAVRKLAWLETVAIKTGDDFTKVIQAGMRKSQITPEEVETAQDSFRNLGGRDAAQ